MVVWEINDLIDFLHGTHSIYLGTRDTGTPFIFRFGNELMVLGPLVF